VGYFRWLENIRDWCISRQLWWGHRIPAYYIMLAGEKDIAPGGPNEDMDRWVAAKSEEEAMEKATARFPGQEVSIAQVHRGPGFDSPTCQ
jgi:valyl-tRNA synthetase